MRRIVVTGLGMVSPVGLNVEDSWKNVVAGKTGVAKITRFAAETFAVQVAGEVKDFFVGDAMDAKEAGRAPLFLQYAAKAAQEAIRQSGLKPDNFSADRAGVCIGVGLGSLDTHSVVRERLAPSITVYDSAHDCQYGVRFSVALAQF